MLAPEAPHNPHADPASRTRPADQLDSSSGPRQSPARIVRYLASGGGAAPVRERASITLTFWPPAARWAAADAPETTSVPAPGVELGGGLCEAFGHPPVSRAPR